MNNHKSHRIRRGFLAMAALAACWTGGGRMLAAEVAVPPDLEPWRAWVLHGEEFRRCPFYAQSGATRANEFVCAWPEKLTLDLDARGGRFTQRWQLQSESWIALPGNVEHWPRDVRVNNARASVVEQSGQPKLLLQPGTYSLSGEFRWERRPEYLPVSAQAGIVELTLDGKRVAQPDRTNVGVWLGQRRTAQERQQMEIQVYRLVQDGIPGRLTTLARLQVSGPGREELLARVLPEGFVPMQMISDLPARIEQDGRLRVQVRAGSWPVTLVARAPSVIQSVRRPESDGPWSKEEIWSFRSDERLRVVSVEGVSGIDPAQAGVPGDWQELPAFRMTAKDEMRLVERSRGLSVADENQLQLARELWLDFDHDGFTARDSITGTMRQGWRLDAVAPQVVLSAEADGENLLITRGADESQTGIELRNPDVLVSAISRISHDGALSATGWQGRFSAVNGVINLPPGHRLLAAVGTDDAPASWVERWRLLDMFLVLIVSVAAARLFGWRVGVLALLAFVLMYHEWHSLAWLFINAIVAYLLAREAPEGRLKRLASGYRNLSYLALLIVLLPFVFLQLRLALHPQLEEQAWAFGGTGQQRGFAMEAPPAEMAPPAERAVPAAPPPPKREGRAGELEALTVTGSMVMRKRATAADEESYGGLNAQQVLQRYAPGTIVQAGPGIPSWRFVSYQFSWSGPVDATQDLRFVVLSPTLLRIWRVLGCVLMAAFFVVLVRASFGWPRQLPQWTSRLGLPGILVAALLGLAGVPVSSADAQTPDAQVLTELKTRLTRPPDCAPNCADIMHANVSAAGDRLTISLQVGALAQTAVSVPSANGRWEPEAISVDGQSNGALLRDSEGHLWVPLRPGTHDVQLAGRIAAVDSLQLQFRMRPRALDVSGAGWEFSGLSEGRLLTDALELLRQRRADAQGRFDPGAAYPSFGRVERLALMDLDWSVQTLVTRMAPDKVALTLPVPLLPGESVLTPGLEVRNGNTVLAAIPAGESSFSWQSGLARAQHLEFSLPENTSRTEIWRFSVSPQWHVTFNGTPVILPVDTSAGQWEFLFVPRPGERLDVAVVRPVASEGGTLAIDNVQLAVDVGKRASTTQLELQYRSTRGGQHTIVLPRDARVTEVTTDGDSSPIRPTNGELTFGILPGHHDIKVQWDNDRGVGINTRAPQVDLRTAASNVKTLLDLPHDRWALFAYGPGVGPAILIWGEIVIFIVLAVLIGRSGISPLRTHEWLLLGLGLSTFSWWVLILFAGWMFSMRFRERLSPGVSRGSFNLVQVLLAILSVIAIFSLIAAIPNGLLGSPDMRIRNVGWSADVFEWFNDRSAGPLPQPGVISVSIWWYKAAMLAWALWLSFALIRWVPWAWRAWTKNGIWRSRAVVPRPADQQQ